MTFSQSDQLASQLHALLTTGAPGCQQTPFVPSMLCSLRPDLAWLTDMLIYIASPLRSSSLARLGTPLGRRSSLAPRLLSSSTNSSPRLHTPPTTTSIAKSPACANQIVTTSWPPFSRTPSDLSTRPTASHAFVPLCIHSTRISHWVFNGLLHHSPKSVYVYVGYLQKSSSRTAKPV